MDLEIKLNIVYLQSVNDSTGEFGKINVNVNWYVAPDWFKKPKAESKSLLELRVLESGLKWPVGNLQCLKIYT